MPRSASEVWGMLGAAALPVVVGLSVLAVDPDAFFRDDAQLQYVPVTRELSRAVLAGELPLSAPGSWFGGALAGEYQHAVFNPLWLAACVVAWALWSSPAAVAAFLALLHLSLLSAGMFRLARGRTTSMAAALLAAAVTSLNGWWATWGATNWLPSLTSFAYLVWAWHALDRAGAAKPPSPPAARGLEVRPANPVATRDDPAGGSAPDPSARATRGHEVRNVAPAATGTEGGIGAERPLPPPSVAAGGQEVRSTDLPATAVEGGTATERPLQPASTAAGGQEVRNAAPAATGADGGIGAERPVQPASSAPGGQEVRSADLAATRRRWMVLAAVGLALSLSSGWPFTVLMAVIITVEVGLVRRTFWPLVGAWLLGGLLAAPALLTFVEYAAWTSRVHPDVPWRTALRIPFAALPGLALPSWTATWAGMGDVPTRRMALELSGALVPLALVFSALVRPDRRRQLARTIVLPAFALVLAMVSVLAPLQWPFRWLPLFAAALGLAAARSADCVKPEHARRAAWGSVAVVVALSTLQFPATPWIAVATAVGCVAWVLAPRAVAPWVTTFAATATMLPAWFIAPADVPRWRIPDVVVRGEGLDRDRRYIAAYTGSELVDAAGGGAGAELWPGNLAMLSGVDFVNGYSPLRQVPHERIFETDVHGDVSPEVVRRLLEHDAGPGGLLGVMGVDGIVTRAQGLPAGWSEASNRDGVRILHRDAPSPRVRAFESVVGVASWQDAVAELTRWPGPTSPAVLVATGFAARTYGPAEVRPVADRRSEALAVATTTDRPALIGFARPWLPGMRATVDGEPVPVLRLNLLMPAVEVPPDRQAHLRVWYEPAGWIVGRALAALGVLAGVALCWRRKASNSR